MVNRSTVYQSLMFLFCVLFGFALIANDQGAGDGVWFWYARILLNGKHLYADMHVATQPVFVLETAWSMALLGKSWLASRVPGVFHLVAYCLGLLLLTRSSRLSDGAKAIVLGFAFFTSLCFEAYRFDDYHVLADCLQVYSLVVLLSLQKARSGKRAALVLPAVLGVLSGLSFTTRVNDGAALFVGVGICILCLAPSKRLLSAALFSVAAALTVVLVVRLTGDSLHDYAYYSIFHAAGSKGGTGHVLLYPLHLPVNTWRWLRNTWFQEVIFYIVAVSLAWALLLRPFFSAPSRKEAVKAAAGVVIIALLSYPFHRAFRDVTCVMIFSALGVFLAYGLSVLVLWRSVRWLLSGKNGLSWNRREILLIIPTGQLASGSMSSGGTHLGLYCPIAIFVLLLPLCSPIQVRTKWVSSGLLAMAALLMVTAIQYRAMNPYSWHSYQEKPLFVGRQWYRHPVYGPMIIDRELLQFIEPVCAQVSAQTGTGLSQGELLSLPFPYSNYFCSVPPWHDYVQTFFDTTSSDTIFKLMGELRQSPPEWIFYQRQMYSLRVHEITFNHGQPLPHRALDQLIEQKLAQGDWQAVYRSSYGPSQGWTNEWILIRTRP